MTAVGGMPFADSGESAGAFKLTVLPHGLALASTGRLRARMGGPFRLVMPISFVVEMREYATQQHWALSGSEKPVDSF
jgi:hypothetical protein